MTIKIYQGSIFLLKVEFFSPLPIKMCVNYLPSRGKFLAPQARFFSAYFLQCSHL